MYAICKGDDGKFYCHGRLQDGTERWVKNTLEEAIKSMKQFAKSMNGQKIKKKNIEYLQTATVAEVKAIPWDPFA